MFNSNYKILRDKFVGLNDFEFSYVFDNFKRLKFQYKCLKICNKLEKINIRKSDIFLLKFLLKLVDFFRWLLFDLCWFLCNGKFFKPFGLTVFVGRQGDGKTISMVECLDNLKKKYPDCLVITNFDYINQDFAFTNWKQFLEIRNDTKGVIFAIDELQNEYNCNSWKDFPEELLSVVTMQRKQRIKILATTQVFTRVVKQLREQCYEVVECKTLLGRWTMQKCYDADDYNCLVDNPDPKRKFKTRKKWRYSFIQSNYIRNLFDSYAVVESIKQKEFINRDER